MLSALALTAAPAHADRPPDPPLRLATYNVCKIACGTGRFSWSNREDAVIRTIRSARPDVIALQEVDNTWESLAGGLRRAGYAPVTPAVDTCSETVCVGDSRLFYRVKRVTQMQTQVPSEPVSAACRPFVTDDGLLPTEPAKPVTPPRPIRADYQDRLAYSEAVRLWSEQRDAAWAAFQVVRDTYDQTMSAYQAAEERHNCSRFVGRTPFTDVGSGLNAWTDIGRDALEDSAQNRNFAWSVFRDRRSGGAFIAVSLHMPNEKTPAAERYRVNLARELVEYLATVRRQYDLPDLPVAIMGDFNSYVQRQPRGVQWVLRTEGFRDAYTAPKRVNEEVPTVNMTRLRPDPFPKRPYRFDAPARLDYVMIDRGRPLRYEVFLRLRPNGDFDNRFRGSDHNLVLADVAWPTVRAGKEWVAAR